jgi:putative flippase GtrA
MAEPKENQDEAGPKAEDIVKQELAHEQEERAKAGRLLRFNAIQSAGVGIVLIIGAALLAYILTMDYVLTTIIGGGGAIAMAFALIMRPTTRSRKDG